MKRLIFTIILAIIAITASAQTDTLSSNWTFQQVRANIWHKATIPGVVHTDLIANNIIEDPFFRLNERGVQWVDKEDWEYKTTFDISDEMFSRQNIELTFYGLDTYADIYLNDSLILQADNMFRPWTVNVKASAKAKGNQLRVYLHSPIKVDIPKFDALDFRYVSDNDQSANGGIFDKQVGIFARKAGYHYGWDWGPRLVTSGIWRPIVVKSWDNLKINNVRYIQENITAKNASLKVIAEVEATKAGSATMTVSTDGLSQKWTTKAQLKAGVNTIEIPVSIRNPKLWWCNGLGEPNLYHFTTSVSLGGTADSRSENIGLRDIKVLREKDEFGTSYTVQINGVKAFMKGANYIPQHSFLTEVTDSMYERTILDAVNANMNMLRVWGGGIYENDIFYDLCDKYGILVWQDFMFACSFYPTEGEMLESVRQEAIDNVVRLRNHPCIALWCGNNECQAAWYGWGYKARYDAMGNGISELIMKQYTDCYLVTLPEVVEKYDDRFYVPSSPFNGNPYSKPETGDSLWNPNGDGHYWGVWQTEGKIATFNDVRCRFFSEYGFQSFPDMQSVLQFAPNPEDHDIHSEVMMSHQRGGSNANNRILWYLESEYRKPADFEETLYLSQLLQGDAIKTAIEAHRRDMPYCMGTLFWQHNDCWPVASWSSRDFYGRWKAQHYFAKKAYRNILVSPIEKEGKISVYIVSDSLNDCNGKLSVSVIDFNGDTIFNETQNVTVKTNASQIYFSKPTKEIIGSKKRTEIFIRAEFVPQQGGYTADNNYFLCTMKEMNFPQAEVDWKSEKTDGGYYVTLSSKTFVRGAYLSIIGVDNSFSDNYFDILPNQPMKIFVRTSISQSDFDKQLQIRAFNVWTPIKKTLPIKETKLQIKDKAIINKTY